MYIAIRLHNLVDIHFNRSMCIDMINYIHILVLLFVLLLVLRCSLIPVLIRIVVLMLLLILVTKLILMLMLITSFCINVHIYLFSRFYLDSCF